MPFFEVLLDKWHLKKQYCGTININGAKVTKQTFVNEQHHDGIIGLAFSHDGRTLAAVFGNGLVSVSNIATQSQMIVGKLSLGDSQVVSAAFSPNGDIAALTAGGQLVQLWDMQAKKCLRNLRFDKPVRHVRFPATSDFERKLFLECETSDGAYYRIDLHTWERKLQTRSQQLLAVQKTIRGRLKGMHIQKLDIADNGNAIIMLKKSPDVYVWNQETRALNACNGHTSPVIDAAVCRAYPKYAASYSDEPYHSRSRSTRYLNGQKVIHAWAIRKGNCMQHLTTNQRSIKKLRFFSTNRVILAGFATNGDILLWELHNRMVNGEEWGHWDPIDTVRSSPGNPLECAISTRDQTLIGAYSNGTLFTRKFSGGNVTQFKVFPGIDPTQLRWTHLDGDAETIDILGRYKNA